MHAQWNAPVCLVVTLDLSFRRGVHGMFPLHLAALSGFSDCCRKLLSSGKLYHCSDSQPVHFLCMDYIIHCCITESLCLPGFDIDTPDDFGRTCLHAAAAGGWDYLRFYSWWWQFFLVTICLYIYIYIYIYIKKHRIKMYWYFWGA